MGMAAGGKGGAKSDMNVTPLIDVVLVLLIIFMVVTPMLQRGKDVKLPPAKKDTTKQGGGSDDPLILSITADKKVWIEQDEVKGDEALRKGLSEVLSKQVDKKILLKGDQTLSFGDVRKVMNIARLAHAKGVALGVEEVDGKK